MVRMINGSDAMLHVIEQWGVKRIYGYPGGSFDSTMNAIYNERERLQFVQVRHEEAGALAAAAEAKLTGKIGVCFGSAGPGAVHLLNGLYDAKADHVPVLAIIAQVPSWNVNIDYFQAIDEEPIFADVSRWNRTVASARRLPEMIDEAIRMAYKFHTVTTVTVPKDFGWQQIPDTFVTTAPLHRPYTYPSPEPADVDKAVALIEQAHAPLIYFGLGARNAADELKAVSEKFKLPLMSTVLGKGVLEERYPAYLGSSGRVGTKPASEAGFGTDLIIWVGNDSPFSLNLINPKAKVIQIDVDPEKLGKRHHVDLPILADAKKTLAAIAAKGHELPGTPYYRASLKNQRNWMEWIDSFVDDTTMPIRPEPIFDVLNHTASDRAVFAVDVGNVNINFARLLNIHGDQLWTTSGQYASMGYALPASVAAKLTYPDRDVYSLSGDGGFAMMMHEVLTQYKYGLHVVNVVFSNETLGFIEAEQTDDTHQPLSGVDIPSTDWATTAKGMGAAGYTVHTKAEMEQALAAARHDKGPVLIDVKLTHEMPLTTQHMFLDPTWQKQSDIDWYVKKYRAQALEPFSQLLQEEQRAAGVTPNAAAAPQQTASAGGQAPAATQTDTVSGASQSHGQQAEAGAGAASQPQWQQASGPDTVSGASQSQWSQGGQQNGGQQASGPDTVSGASQH